MKLKIKKGDTVEVIAGSEKGKKGKVLDVRPLKLKIKVEGIRVQTNYDKKDGIKRLEGFIDYSNVRLAQAAVSAASTKKKTVSVKTVGEEGAAPAAATKPEKKPKVKAKENADSTSEKVKAPSTKKAAPKTKEKAEKTTTAKA